MTPEERKRIGRQLRALRVANGLQQRDVGAWTERGRGRPRIRHENSGVSLGTLQMIEKGEGREVRESNIDQVAAFLGTSLDLLRAERDIRPSDPRLEELNDESLLVARRYVRAVTEVRHRVLQLLRDGSRDIAVRLNRLSDSYAQSVEQLVTEGERLQQENGVVVIAPRDKKLV